jgi:hypothetical protein
MLFFMYIFPALLFLIICIAAGSDEVVLGDFAVNETIQSMYREERCTKPTNK